MSAWLLKFTKLFFLVTGIIALGYSDWSYFDEFWRQRSDSESFDRARETQYGRVQTHTRPFTGRLKVPRLRVTAMVEEGVGESTLRHAVGHIPNTALPGRPGNVGVAGHRDRLFHKLKGIKRRDRIVLSTLTRDYDYEVTSISIVNPDDISVLAPSPGQKTLTLVTCYPFSFIGDAPERFIVRARQIDERTLAGRRVRQ